MRMTNGCKWMEKSITAFWFRRDLRLNDNAGLFQALTSGNPVLPVFIFDKNILDDLPEKDARVEFIHHQIESIQDQLVGMGSSLLVKHGKPDEIWKEIIDEYPVRAVLTNHDYEPYAKKRDVEMAELLETSGIEFSTFQDQVIYEKEDLLSGQGTPYTVFTPYSKKWKASLTDEHTQSYDCESHWDQFLKIAPISIPSLNSMNFAPTGIDFPKRVPDIEIIDTYDKTRNFPAQRGTTRMGIHLRFGTISIRKLVRIALKHNETYLNELIWREFYMQILWNFPHVVDEPFRAKYKGIPWRNDEKEFEKWCEGKTGYPMVDAGMRELNETGYMHNRVRMVVASFLTKHLLINWQWGEAYFAEKLLDFELASNNGGWQWASGSGTDAAPYFRIFNPESQMKKFDPKLKYVRKWVPEYGTPAYPKPIVEHKFARGRCLEAYKDALNSQG